MTNIITLKDDKTSLVIEARNTLEIYRSDGVMYDNTVKKCDFIISDSDEIETHLMEFKGVVIDHAYKQLQATINNLLNDKRYNFLINKRNSVDAYIVTKGIRQRTRGIDTAERLLAKSLSTRCKQRQSDILDLVKYVTKSPNNKYSYNKQMRTILYTGREGLKLPFKE